MMQKKGLLVIFIFLVMLILISVPVSATVQTITLANPDGTGQRDVIVYYANGTLYGLYNTTSTIQFEDQANNSYIFALKPQGNNFIDDPGDWLTNYAFPYVRTNIIAIIIICAIVGFLVGRR